MGLAAARVAVLQESDERERAEHHRRRARGQSVEAVGEVHRVRGGRDDQVRDDHEADRNAQTLRSAHDLPSAEQALDHRIRALAQAHDLLTSRSWTGANLNDLAVRTLEAFAPTQVTMFGDPIDVSPKHALALSLALHELATNAIKYGALSCPEGRMSLKWQVHEGTLHLDWEEIGGPRVRPTHQERVSAAGCWNSLWRATWADRQR